MTELEVNERGYPTGNTIVHRTTNPAFANYTPEQLDVLKRTIAKGTTDDEFALFIATAQRRGLDPFTGEIHCVMRKEKNQDTGNWEPKMSIQTGIDGYRAMAEDTGRYAGRLGPYWCGPDGAWRDVWLEKTPPFAAKVGVRKDGIDEPFWAVAHWSEYKQTKTGGDLVYMWAKMPAGQLAKCAEALALRSAFPRKLGGIYTHDEMGQADNPPMTVVTVGQPQSSGLVSRQGGGSAARPASPDATMTQAPGGAVLGKDRPAGTTAPARTIHDVLDEVSAELREPIDVGDAVIALKVQWPDAADRCTPERVEAMRGANLAEAERAIRAHLLPAARDAASRPPMQDSALLRAIAAEDPVIAALTADRPDSETAPGGEG